MNEKKGKRKSFLAQALLFLAMFAFVFQVEAQVTIGSGLVPDKDALLDLKEEEDGSSRKGVLLPRVALVDLDDPSPLIEHTEGMYVYNTSREGDLIPGNYFNDGTKWVRVKDIISEPWLNSETNEGATQVDENIYHTGTVAMGTTTTDASAQVEIASNSKGLLIPRLSREDRNALINPANGLIIFNTTSNCLNYYDSQVQRWLSMCGTYDPAVIDLLNCNSPVGPLGTYTEGKSLTTDNFYVLVVNVSEIGTYEIVAKTNNGYAFSKSGLFTSTGNHTVILEGQGAPVREGIDEITLTFNGATVTPNCQLPTINVEAASIRLTVDCSTIRVYGEYLTNVNLSPSTDYIEVEVNVTTAGETVIETLLENNIKFSTGSISLSTGVQTIRLYGQGTPSRPGTFTGHSFTISGATCAPTVVVKSSTGSYDYPANRCQEILDEDPNAQDGYYWVKEASGAKFKTYCDMEPDGAWTLVKSLSERQILVVEKTQNESIGSQKARNSVTTKEGKFNEYAFSLAAATVNNIGSSVGEKKFKFTIKEQGHTTDANATYEEIEASTVSPNDDVWLQDNYWIVTIYSGNPATGNYTNKNNMTEGKLFGFPWGKPSASSNNYYFNDVRFSINPPGGMYSYSGFFTGFYGAIGYVGSNTAANNLTYTYHDRTDGNNGATYTFNKYYINDLFGVYMNSERQLNHHIGTCANSSDDFGGASYCAAGWSNWRAHRFNQRPDGTYEGRILQHWVK